ncbi:hypothetical protein V5P93_006659 [Actinokineospora auranticolor]|uniref:Uncharacterized protein n=1 Tax=Actinokineospora auranticolor TaxID=155976 RepID=A0A2S6GWW9_9PSEU|nr:hypothetical protein [Actinokineospora auranticolor]PPK69698.1 hypothetical protein CLV40_103308 [Actinokineospora auranticolor]
MGWWNQPRDAGGRWTVKGGAGVTVTGAAIALAVANGTGGAATGAAVEAAGQAAVEQAGGQAARGNTRRARKSESDKSWRRMRLKQVREATEQAANCAVNSYGQVREFFLRNPCRSLERTLFTLAAPDGGTFVVSVSWVRMRGSGDTGDLRRLIDRDGTGSVKSIGFDLLEGQGVRFTGTPYRSRPKRDLLVVAEGAVVSGKPDPGLMRMAVDAAAELPG